MPNWCFNSLDVSGARNDLLAFVERARGHSFACESELPLSLHALVPEPDFERDTDGYNWRCTVWGTKWDLDDVRFQDGEVFLRYEFATASNPPRSWLQRVSCEFPALRLDLVYAEPGMVFAGELVCERAIVCTTYHTNDRRRYNDLVRERFGSDEGLLVDEGDG